MSATKLLAELLAKVDAVSRQECVRVAAPRHGHLGQESPHLGRRHRRCAQVDRLPIRVHRILFRIARVDPGPSALDEAERPLPAKDLDAAVVDAAEEPPPDGPRERVDAGDGGVDGLGGGVRDVVDVEEDGRRCRRRRRGGGHF